MKYILLIISIVSCSSSFAQDRTFYGRIIDKDTKSGIPFSVVQAKDINNGTYSDEHGVFSLRVNMDSVKTLVFYCMGYERKEMNIDKVPGDSIIIELQRTSNTLNEVVVTPGNDKLKEYILGKKDLQPYGICTHSFGGEAAIFLNAKNSPHNYLKEVFFYVTNDGMPETKFRVHVYGIDSTGLYPGKDLTDSNIIVHADKGNEWVGVDLSSKKIPLGKGIFISMEWIKPGSYFGRMEGGAPGKRSREEINCQVLAGTRGYDKEGLIWVVKYPFFTRWQDGWSQFNPMIYATYNRIK